MASQTIVTTAKFVATEEGVQQTAAALAKLQAEALKASGAMPTFSKATQAALAQVAKDQENARKAVEAARAAFNDKGEGREFTLQIEQNARALQKLADEARKVTGALDPAARATMALAQHQERLNALVEAGALSWDDHAKYTSIVNERMAKFGNVANDAGERVKLTSDQVRNLGFQLNDAATMLASGSSPFQVIATQSGQVIQALGDGPAGVRGSLQAMFDTAKAGAISAAGALGPVGIGLVGLTAAAGAFALAMRKSVPDATETLKKHSEILDRVGQQYEGISDVLDQIGQRGDIGVNIELGANGRSLVESLRAQVKQAERELAGGQGFMGTLMFGTDDTASLPSLPKFKPIEDRLNTLREAFRAPNADVVALSREIVGFNASLGQAYDTAGNDTAMRKAIEAARDLLKPLLETATALDQNAAAASGAARALAGYNAAMEELGSFTPDTRTEAEKIEEAFARASNAARSMGQAMEAVRKREQALSADATGAIDLLNAARAEGASIGLGEEARAVAGVEQEYAKLKAQYQGNTEALIALDQWRQQSIDNAGSQAAFDREAEAAKEAEAAAKRATDEAQRYAEATRSRIDGIDQTVAAQRMEVELLGASEGASAALRFEFQALTAAKQAAAAVGGIVSDAELAKIQEAAEQIGILTNQLAAANAANSAVDQFFPMEAAAREAERLGGFIADTTNGLSDLQRQALGMQIDQGFIDAAEAAEQLRTGGKKAAEDIGASFIENVGDVFSDIFGQATRDGQSFFDSVLQGLAGLGSQLAAAGAKNLFGKLFGLPQDAKTQSAAGIGGLIGQGAGYLGSNDATGGSRYGAISSAPLSALNDNLAKTSRSAMDVAKQFAGLNERADTKVLDGFLRASGQWKGLSASDTAWCAAFANAAIAQTGGQGTGSNLASSFMNWGMGTSAPKAGDIVVLKPQARGASGHVGFVAGFGDGTVQVFGGNQSGGANTKSFGLDQVRSYRTASGNAPAAVQPASASAAYAPLSRRDLSAGVTDGLKTYQDRYAPSYGDYTARGVDPWQGANGQSLRGVSFGQTALGALGAGAGIFSQGYQSGNPLMGGLSGAMGGFQAGSALFPALGMAGPIGAGIGALVGIAGGIFGKRAERKKAHQEAAAKWEQMRPQYEAFDQSLSGDTKGGLRTWITDQWNQLSGFMSVGGAAWKNGTGNSTAQFRSTGTKLFERFHEMIREFQDGYVSMIHDMESGEGLQGAFAKGRNATKDLKAQIQATRDDIDIAFGNVADIGFLNTPDAVAQAKASEEARAVAIERYNKAAGEYALSLMYTSVQVSDVQKTIDGFRGTAAGLHDVFADLGWSAEDAAAAINERLNQAIANVAKGLNEGIRDRIEELAGVGYFSSVRSFLAEFDTLKADVAAAGADPSQLNDLFGRELQAIVDGAELTGTAFTDLVAMFPQLAGVVREFTETAVAASAAEIKSAIESYGERLFQAQHVGDELALFDRKAAQERLEAARYGADGVAALEAALAAERLNIVRTQEQTLASNRYEAAVNARGEAESALRAEYERTVDYVDGIRGYLSDMRLDDNLSVLNGQQQFDEAQRLYRETLFKANGGDQDAQDKLLGVTQDYLDEAKAYYASSEAYGAVYKEIETTLKATATRAETELDVAKRQAGSLLDIAENTKGLSALLADLAASRSAADKAFQAVNDNRVWESSGSTVARNKYVVSELAKNGINYAGNFGGGQFNNWASTQSPTDYALIYSILARYDAMKGAVGFATGGYTGAGGLNEPAGIVHRGEFVMDAAATRAIGVPALDVAMRTQRLPAVTMPAMPRVSGTDNAALVAELKASRAENAQLMRLLIQTTGGGLDRVAQTGDRTARAAEQSALADRRNTNNKQAA